MPTSVELFAVDTSVAVAALDASHAAHIACRTIVQRHRPTLSGHAVFETFSVLTRMPGQIAVDAPTAALIIKRVFPKVSWLDNDAAVALLQRLGAVGIVGGSVYDALVGEAARLDRRRLLTRDNRARRTYDLLGVSYVLIE